MTDDRNGQNRTAGITHTHTLPFSITHSHTRPDTYIHTRHLVHDIHSYTYILILTHTPLDTIILASGEYIYDRATKQGKRVQANLGPYRLTVS